MSTDPERNINNHLYLKNPFPLGHMGKGLTGWGVRVEIS